jgi:eukaryotic-like serine/threonine-protein kinase
MINKTLGHYRVGEQLGRGGMGEVYLADDLNLNRKVALKFLPDAFAGDPERMARFEREAKLLASLNHANIAAIYGLEQAEGKRFIVMEFVEGETLGHVGEPGYLGRNFDLSPDGNRMAFTQNDDLWLMEFERNLTTRLTFDSARKENVAWSPDGLRIAFTSSRKGNWDIFVKKVSGVEEETPVAESADPKWVKDWSKDGRYIAYTFGMADTDLYTIPLFGDRKPFPIVQSPSSQDMPRFSYDGKWLAYDSNESGTWQVYVVSFPAADQKFQISTSGGAQPRWRRDGKELYHLARDGKMMAVDIEGDAGIKPGIPHMLFNTELDVDPVNDQYAVTADGRRFLLLKPLAESASTPITIVLNWTSLLKK